MLGAVLFIAGCWQVYRINVYNESEEQGNKKRRNWILLWAAAFIAWSFGL